MTNDHAEPLPADTPVLKTDIRSMPLSEIEAWVQGVRERRLVLRHKYEEQQQKLRELKNKKAAEQLRAKLLQFDKLMVSVDKALVRAENLMLKVKALQLVLSGTDTDAVAEEPDTEEHEDGGE